MTNESRKTSKTVEQPTPLGPIATALVADLEEYKLEDTPSGRTLAAAAMALASALDREPNAAAAKELRLFLATLTQAHADRPDDELQSFLDGLSPWKQSAD